MHDIWKINSALISMSFRQAIIIKGFNHCCALVVGRAKSPP